MLINDGNSTLFIHCTIFSFDLSIHSSLSVSVLIVFWITDWICSW